MDAPQVNGGSLNRTVGQILTLTIAGALFCTDLRADSTIADRYRTYVDNAIQLSFVLADKDAAIRESALFAKLGSEAQSHLSDASENVRAILLLAPSLRDSSSILTSTLSADELISQLLISTQLADHSSQLRLHLAAYKTISDNLTKACNDGFDNYSIEKVRADFAQPDVNPFDGVYVSCSVKSDGQSSGQQQNSSCDPFIFLASIGESLYNIFANLFAQNSIDNDFHRLERDRAKDTDYRNYAKHHCEDYKAALTAQLRAYDSIATLLNDSADTMPADKVQQAHDSFKRFLVGKYEQDYIKSQITQARTKALRTLTAQDERDTLLKISVSTNLALADQIAGLASIPCPKASGIRQLAENQMALRRLFSLDVENTQAALKKAEDNADRRCQLKTRAQSSPVPGLVLAAYHPKAPLVAFQVAVYAGTLRCLLQARTRPSFCADLNDNQSSGSGVYTYEFGGYCGSSAVGSYSYCNSAPTVAGQAGSDPWGSSRTYVALAEHFPGLVPIFETTS